MKTLAVALDATASGTRGATAARSSTRGAVRAFVLSALGGVVGLCGSFVLLEVSGHARHDVEWAVTAVALLLACAVCVAAAARSVAVAVATVLGLVLASLVSWVTIVAHVMG